LRERVLPCDPFGGFSLQHQRWWARSICSDDVDIHSPRQVWKQSSRAVNSPELRRAALRAARVGIIHSLLILAQRTGTDKSKSHHWRSPVTASHTRTVCSIGGHLLWCEQQREARCGGCSSRISSGGSPGDKNARALVGKGGHQKNTQGSALGCRWRHPVTTHVSPGRGVGSLSRQAGARTQSGSSAGGALRAAGWLAAGWPAGLVSSVAIAPSPSHLLRRASAPALLGLRLVSARFNLTA